MASVDKSWNPEKGLVSLDFTARLVRARQRRPMQELEAKGPEAAISFPPCPTLELAEDMESLEDSLKLWDVAVSGGTSSHRTQTQ